ncbi:MAG: protein-glutamate O-methyltransferase CheR [Bdellovibrionales bacterium]|nr:protein-glutamate O-methyltransferase CheR [Bdellovibrionales bacterium]
MSVLPKPFISFGRGTLAEQQQELERIGLDGIGFNRLSALLKELTGISLEDNSKNRSLMVSRVVQTLRARELGSLSDYFNLLRSARADSEEIAEFVSKMTTNTTRFFRESAHFKQLQTVIPTILSEKEKMHGVDSTEIRVWCAASSTGQEPYTLAMVMLEELARIAPQKPWRLKILASDIDRPSLHKAVSGIYLQQEIENIPPELLKKYFVERVDGSAGKRFVVHPALSKKITFAEINLTTQPYPMQRLFDVIFCRNVLIYFNRQTAEQVVSNLERVLRPGGYLFLGHSESGSMRNTKFQTISHAVYRKKGDLK